MDYHANDGRFYLFHTRYGSVVSTDSSHEFILRKILEQPECFSNTSAYKVLTDLGFLISNEIDEYQSVLGQNIYDKYCKNNYLEHIILPT